MKGPLHPKNDKTLNPSGNESIRDVIGRVNMKRRRFIFTAVGASVATVLGNVTIRGLLQTVATSPLAPGMGFAGIGFEGIEPNLLNPATGLLEKDLVTVPRGYKAQVLVAWGDPIMPGGPNWSSDASQDAAAQEKQFGMNADGMHFFPMPRRQNSRDQNQTYNQGILCVNHEYTQEHFLHPDGLDEVSIEKVRKSQAAHGVSIVEISKDSSGNNWSVNPNSRYGRRITANTEMRISGPVAGSDFVKSKKFNIKPEGSLEIGVNDGYTAYGTVNNCSNGYTPWGTYLTCEENWNNYFTNPLGNDITPVPGVDKSDILQGQNRYGIATSNSRYPWAVADPRFDTSTNPLEPHLFGWVVEIDPYNPRSKPVKRTAMGRFKHESAQYVLDDNNRLAFYMGDDERNEYIYKFVCSQPYNPQNPSANLDLLDYGTLYVAKFNDNGTGEWLPLVYGRGGLTPENGFNSQAEVLVKTRQAADRVGATMMDRPEWTAVRPRIGGYQEIEVYCTLTNNNRRGTQPESVNEADGSSKGGSASPPVNAANPRPDNRYGHIIRWREDGRTVASTTFNWDIFVECGDKLDSDPHHVGNINGDDLSSPDGLRFDDFGRLWIQTDHEGDGTDDVANIGSNTMSCANPNDPREIKRFLTSPTDCEVSGIAMTPDGKAMFVNIQHPNSRGTKENPTSRGNWPHSQGYGPSGRPRSATVLITRDDGGIIGA